MRRFEIKTNLKSIDSTKKFQRWSGRTKAKNKQEILRLLKKHYGPCRSAQILTSSVTEYTFLTGDLFIAKATVEEI